jgi:hypothetical protein
VKQDGTSWGSAALAFNDPWEADPWPLAPTPREVPEPAVALEVALVRPAAPGPAKYHVSEETGQVRRFLDKFTNYHRSLLARWLERSGRYVEMIREVFREAGLPDDLLFTAMQESGFNPLAVSRAGAKGLWQFMAPTARRYGLRVDHWLDERLDPEKSTVAAARYLSDLHGMFGSWTLAQAAYNAGENRVARAIEAMQTRDFWELSRGRHLADETKDFVASIQALTLIGRDPTRYGIEFTPHPPQPYQVVLVPPATVLRHLAARGGFRVEELQELNPGLRRGKTPPDGPYALKVPPELVGRTRAALTGEAKASSGSASLKGQRSMVVSGRFGGPRPAAVHPGAADRETWVSVSDALRLAVPTPPPSIGTAERLRVQPFQR